MTPEDLRAYCLTLPGAREERPFGPDTAVFKVGRKVFAISRLEPDPLEVSVKGEPELNEQLRAAYEAVRPGWHLNKRHWNTVTVNADVPDQQVKDLVEDSYDLVKPKRRTVG